MANQELLELIAGYRADLKSRGINDPDELDRKTDALVAQYESKQQAQPQMVDNWAKQTGDVVASGAAGVLRGMANVGGLPGAVLNPVLEKLPGGPYNIPSSESIKREFEVFSGTDLDAPIDSGINKSAAGFGEAIGGSALLPGGLAATGIKTAIGGETARQFAESLGAGKVGSTVAGLAGGLASTPKTTWEATKATGSLFKRGWDFVRGVPSAEKAVTALRNMAGGEAAVMGAASKNSEVGKAVFHDLATKEAEAFDNLKNHPELFDDITGAAAGDWTNAGTNFQTFQKRASAIGEKSIQNRNAAYNLITEAEEKARATNQFKGISFQEIQNPSFLTEGGNTLDLNTLKKLVFPTKTNPLALAEADVRTLFPVPKSFKEADEALMQLDSRIADLGGYAVKGKLLDDGKTLVGNEDLGNWINALKLYRGELKRKLEAYGNQLGVNNAITTWKQADLDYRTAKKLTEVASNQYASAMQNISLRPGASLLQEAGPEGGGIKKYASKVASLFDSPESAAMQSLQTGTRQAAAQMQAPLDMLAIIAQADQQKMMAMIPRNLAQIKSDLYAAGKVGSLAVTLGLTKDPNIMLTAPTAQAEELLNQVIQIAPDAFTRGPDNFKSAKNKDGKWYLTNPMEKDLLISDTIKSKNPAERAMTIGKLYEDSSFTPKETPTVEESPLPIDPLAAFNNLNNEPPTQNFTPNQSDSEIMLQQMNRHAQTYGQ